MNEKLLSVLVSIVPIAIQQLAPPVIAMLLHPSSPVNKIFFNDKFIVEFREQNGETFYIGTLRAATDDTISTEACDVRDSPSITIYKCQDSEGNSFECVWRKDSPKLLEVNVTPKNRAKYTVILTH